MNYTSISIKDARNNLSEIIERAALAKESFLLTKFGKPKVLIAATALSHDLTLVTNDTKHFKFIAGLEVVSLQ